MTGSTASGASSPRGGRAALAAALLVAAGVALANTDLLTGRATPFYRDIGTTQRPARALFASLGPAALNPHASFGQPYLGNPNFVLAYPFPKAPRFLGLDLLLHLGLGLAGAFLLFRRLVRSRDAALFGAFAYGLSGYVVSSAAFLNATTTIAWIPWLLTGVLAARGSTGRKLLLPLLGIAAVTTLLVSGGEPALATLGLAVAGALALTGPAGTRRRALLALLAGGLLAGLVLSPWLLEAFRASVSSSRRVRGFSWTEFGAVRFHPARFLETPFPLLFGDPARLVSGAFWGFAVNQGNLPYLASLSFGVLPLALALVFVLSARRYEGRFWIGAAAASLLAAVFPWLPGARAVYEALPPLHVLRYPVKAMLVFTLSVSALAALAADRLLIEGALPRFRRRAAWGFLAGAALLAAVSLASRVYPGRAETLLLHAWDSTWVSDPHVVLAPVVRRLPVQAAFAAGLLLAGGALLRRGASDGWSRFVLLAAVATDLLLASVRLLPRAPAVWYEAPSPLVARAAAIPGRVFEQAGKDFDAVRRGLFGRVPADDIVSLALAQARQGWSQGGAPHGLRYAYDSDPDGSYTFLNRVATDVVNQRGWPLKLKWLRAGGTGTVIESALPAGTPGLEAVAVEDAIGVPVTLYRLTVPLPGLRRLSRVFGSRSIPEAVARFERDDFDPATDVVVAGPAPPGTSPDSADPAASARLLREGPDALTVETSGTRPGVLHVDRSYTGRVRVLVDGRAAPVLAADLHLLGIPVPAGLARVEIDLAP